MKTLVNIPFYSIAIATPMKTSELKESEKGKGLEDSTLFRRSALYKEFLAEREQILKHKWIESEKAGRDIGFEQALHDWIVKYRTNWRRSRKGTPLSSS